MSRPLRIEFPNAWYHVMNRGRRGEAIFQEESDYEIFLKLLKETKERFHLNVSGYCLMPNYYHLLVKTPHSNLSRCMRHINGVYTQRYNRFHECDSQLFRGRYKAIVIEEDSYMLEVLRYIHRNPFNAGLENELGDYTWSSHNGYISSEKQFSWLYKKPLLKYFSSDKSKQIPLYQSFMEQEEPEEVKSFYEAKKIPPVVGSDTFIQKLRDTYLNEVSLHEFPELKSFAISEITVFAKICQFYEISEAALFQSKRGQNNEARDVAIFLMNHFCFTPYQQIAEQFNVNTVSTISTATSRVRKRLESDVRFIRKINKIKKLIKAK